MSYSSVQCKFEEHILTALKLPDYFALYGRHEPATRTHASYASARENPESEVWELYGENPEQIKGAMQRMEMPQQFIPLEGIYDFSWV
ncbi:uncharacterized protein LY79DRAFT_104488 [Colletotrichum navitas]|uniref:Uncharacterized protein n=1 Tax=Colletotrichum navitas TaxID=681940 RepID=A0AAD8PKR6_9PEZI|nr:uncharacterized protein LY79DRAFT_104488 [Colletotrichum navitas]KAK1566189.1 hypothetical protein LY79DRAFT_104488 [Colletotrichum navitas]